MSFLSWIPTLGIPSPALIIVLVWFIAQTIKILLALAMHRHSLATYVAPGGMPSVHSAIVASLSVVMLLRDGWRSTSFAIAVAITGLTVFDALVIRQEVGRQARVINRLEAELAPVDVPDRLKEVLGHRPTEIVMGLALGAVLALLLAPH